VIVSASQPQMLVVAGRLLLSVIGTIPSALLHHETNAFYAPCHARGIF